MLKRAVINLEGIVQGVGLRPFIHRQAKKLALTGSVRNTSRGVEIILEGKETKINGFYTSLQNKIPPLAKIYNRRITFLARKGYDNFTIKESQRKTAKSTLISPDISICNDCLKELLNPNDRRYLYPFINCTNCGPRFSIIQDLPYDRYFTTMKEFNLCEDCKQEFEDINNRRYHAQPNACITCGPAVELIKSRGIRAISLCEGNAAIKTAVKLLRQGEIVAVKSLGGFHLACDADNLSAIKKLRSRKNRLFKPLAIMASGIDALEDICDISSAEKSALKSPERPIVLLKKKTTSDISEALSPNNNYLGAMLPYTPLHYLLFFLESDGGYRIRKLVMTSANIADEPIETDNRQAINNLKSICNFFLVNNREIYNRTDDSIVQFINNTPVLLRRSRGYAPLPILLKQNLKHSLSCGAELKNTFCLSKGKAAFLSQHIGYLKTYSGFNFYKDNIAGFLRLFDIKPKIIAYDPHPDYSSAKYASALKSEFKNAELIPVQHHRAHVAAVIAEHRIKSKVIGICFDGAGFGSDGKIWGGEFFTGDLKRLSRKAYFEYVAMPGADKASQEPYRMAISHLYNAFSEKIYDLKINLIAKHRPKLYNIINLIRHTDIYTSSVGRLFDAVSSLIGVCDINTYEAQAAIELQALAENSHTRKGYNFKTQEKEGCFIIDMKGLINQIINDITKNVPRQEIARKFHNGLTDITVTVCCLLSKETGIKTIVIAGGVFQNKLLAETLIGLLKRKKFNAYYNQAIPPNDGSISLGQIATANELAEG